MASPDASIPQRGEIWLVNFDPTIGREIRKTRPAVVVSSDAVGRLPIKLVAPVTDWKEHFAPNIWHVRIDPDPTNRLTKVSAVDALQLRGMDHRRFVRKLGQVSPTTMEEIGLLRRSSNTHNAKEGKGDRLLFCRISSTSEARQLKFTCSISWLSKYLFSPSTGENERGGAFPRRGGRN